MCVCVCVCVCVCKWLLTPSYEKDVTQDEFFERSWTDLNSEFSFYKITCHTKVKEPNISYYLPMAREENT